jgi:hypothetical protein
MNENTTKPSASYLLAVFGNKLKALAEHRDGKSRPIAAIDVNGFVATFVRENAELIASVEGPDLDNMRLISGRVSGDDDDTVHIVEAGTGVAHQQRFEDELGSYEDGDDAVEIFTILDCSLKVAIDQRLRARA